MSLFWLVIILYFLCAYNASFWLVYSEGPYGIFNKFRDWVERVSPQMRKALDCMNCTPTWVGLIASTVDTFFIKGLSITPWGLFLQNTNIWWLAIPLDALVTSGVVYLIHTFQEMMERIGTDGNQ